MIRIGLMQSLEVEQHLRRLMRSLVDVTATVIAADAVATLVDGAAGAAAHAILWSACSLYYLLVPVPALLWYLTILRLAVDDETLFRRHAVPTIVVCATITALVMANPATHALFSISPDNHYQRGPLFFLACALPYIVFPVSSLLIYGHRGNGALKLMAARSFWLPPIIAGIVQHALRGSNLILPSMAICILMLYSSLQASNSRLDYLTGVHTRRYLDQFLRGRQAHRGLGAIMVDVDRFKEINDHFGHVVGDEVLIGVASALRMSTSQSDCVARWGGDEFVVIIDSGDPRAVQRITNQLSLRVAQFNEASDYPFQVSLSTGFDVWGADDQPTVQRLIRRIDALMYGNKATREQTLELKQH
jgi:diguanylate cyclase (GGDEF)-like protein